MASTNIFAYPARFQFNQAGAPCYGKSCCTDTCIQMVAEYYKDVKYSLSSIRRIAQSETSFNEAPYTGINVKETDVALTKLGLGHYTIARGISAGFVRSKTAIGPVIVGVWYGRYPNIRGGGRTNQAEYEGRDDYGFTGSHAVIAIGSRSHEGHYDLFMRDPDHASPSRPHKPKYDIIKQSQLQYAMEGFARNTDFGTTYCMYPTKRKVLAPSVVWGSDVNDDIKRAYTAAQVAKRLRSLGITNYGGAINDTDIAAGLKKLGIGYGNGIQLTDVRALMK